MKKRAIIGIIVILIGIHVLFQALHFSSGSLLAPLIFLALAVFFYKRNHGFLGVSFFVIGIGILFDRLFGVNFFGLLLAGAAIYYGVRLVRESKQKEKRNEEVKEPVRPRVSAPFQRNWIGDVHYKGKAFELNDMTILNGIGDVHFDLTSAIIPDGETVIVVQSFIGQIVFYVPDDLPLSVQASSLLGEVSVFHELYSGVNNHVHIASPSYKQESRRVKLVLHTIIGEVKVRAI